MKPDLRDYRLSFTVGGLLLHESIALAEAWGTSRDWRAAREAVPGNLFVATGGASSASRLRNEAIRRLRTLDEAELVHLASCPITDARALCWAAACREYRFLSDFAWQVLIDRHHPYAEPIRGADFEMLMDGLDATNARAAPVSRSTRARLRTVLLRMLREAELIDAEGRVLTLPITEALRALLAGHADGGLDCIPGGR
jgi:predicted metal-binding protein